MFTECVQARRVVCGPEPEADAVEAGSFLGPGEGGQHKVSLAGSRDSGLQRRQDTHGESRPMEWSIGGVEIKWLITYISTYMVQEIFKCSNYLHSACRYLNYVVLLKVPYRDANDQLVY